MRTVNLTRTEAMESRKELVSILKSYGIYNSYVQDQFIKQAIMNFEIEDMPNSTREEKISKLFQNIRMSLRYEIAKYDQGKKTKNDDNTVKVKIYQQINSAKDNLIFDNLKYDDILTDYGRGLVDSSERDFKTYFEKDIYYPKIEEYRTDYGKGLEPKFDSRTDFGKGLEPKFDPRTDFGKGFYYKSQDGREHATMEAVEQADKIYWASMMKYPTSNDLIKYNKIENAYFDIITPNIVDIDDINIASEQFLREQTEKMMDHIEARYGKYLKQLLEELGYGRQDNNRGPKR